MDQSPADVLATVITRISSVAGQVDGAERAPWLFVRSVLAECRFQLMDQAARDASVLEAAIGDFFALPRDFPGRPRLAAILVEAQFHSRRLHETQWVDTMVRLADIANSQPDLHPEWPKRDAVVRALALSLAARDLKPGFSAPAALKQLDRYAEIVGDEQPLAAIVDNARLAIRITNVGQTDDLSEFTRLADRAETGLRSLGPDAMSPDRLGLYRAMVAIMDKAQRGDLAGALAMLTEARKTVKALPPEDRVRIAFEQAMVTLESLAPTLVAGPEFDDVDGAVVPPRLETLSRLKEWAAQPGLSGPERATRLAAVVGAMQTVDTLASLEEASEVARQVLALSPPNDPRRPYYLFAAAMIHGRRAEITGDRGGTEIARAIALFEEARGLAASSTHALWNTLTTPLAHLYRLSGRKDLARHTALTGLRGHAWSTLLQSNIADMHAAARHAAGSALDTARWCLEDNNAEDAVNALELGRGLIQYAASENRDVDTRLAAAGQPQLATRWRHAQENAPLHEVPATLRQQVASVLAGVPLDPDGTPTAAPAETNARLLEPPSTHEIRAALAALGTDALVYLMPGDDGSGAAVVVPADGAAEWLRLPELNQRSLTGFERFIAGQARSAALEQADARDAGFAQHTNVNANSERPDSEVGRVCDWAWRSAIGPLLERFLHLPEGRPIRLVLIPVRELSRVPWHAARYRDASGRRRYALESAVFSYAASARSLCETAWRPQVAVGGPALIVSDPDTAHQASDLPAARLEARAVKDVFYPDAHFLGRLPDGSGAPQGEASADQVKKWLADPEAGSVVHLACHAFVRAGTGPDETSYLLLANGQRLGTEEMIGTMTGACGRTLALAVLAACNSAESSRGYDQAFSLATAFVANNTNSVISAQWSVPDVQTSLLMFMFHHYINAERMSPVDALRQAQLWILSDREPPATMPAELRRHLNLTADETADPATWAGFIHSGR